MHLKTQSHTNVTSLLPLTGRLTQIKSMDFTQGKLTKSEWDGVEVPDSHDEQQIYQLIKDGYHNVNFVRNSSQK